MCDNCKRLETLLDHTIKALNCERERNDELECDINRINKITIQKRLEDNNVYLAELEHRLSNLIEFLQKRVKH